MNVGAREAVTDDLRQVERVILALALSIAAVIRIVAVFRFRIDSDETQHLHVVWGWTRDLIQYRDVFDNHMPLFHILSAPLLRLFGERAETIIWMRLLMVPLYAAALFLTYRIANACFSRRVAAWSTAFAALVPTFLLCSSEYRPDTLWAVCWLTAIAILVSARPDPLRALAAGLAIGLATAVSLKTTLLILALAVGILTAIWTSPSLRSSWRSLLKTLIPLLLGMFSIPVATAIYFAYRGAWQSFIYGTVGHNLLWRWHTNRLIAYPCFLILIALWVRQQPRDPRRVFLIVTAHFFAATLFCLWPIVEREHWLPYCPIAAITFTPLLLRGRRVLVPAFALVVMVILNIGIGHLWKNETEPDLALIRETLRLTGPSDPVIDLRGESVFRPRPFFYALETLTKQRIRAGLIDDSIAAATLKSRAMVAAADSPAFPPGARAFLRDNFVLVGRIRVPGRFLSSRTRRFVIRVPAQYALVGANGSFTGLLDGQPYRGPRYLRAGLHTLEPRTGGSYALVWSRALERGLSPFKVNDPS